MQRDISTNLRIPEDLWKAIKIRAAEQGKSMKDLIIEGINLVLGRTNSSRSEESGEDLLLQFSGKVKIDIPQGASDHDRYLYEK